MAQVITVNSTATLAEAIGELRRLFVERRYFQLVVRGKSRTGEQNALSHAWYQQVSLETGEDSPEGIKRFCKLHFGVPILRAEDEEFRAAYDRVIKPLPYADKLPAMDLLPVTSRMNTTQLSQYLQDLQRHYADRDTDPVLLEFPEDVRWAP